MNLMMQKLEWWIHHCIIGLLFWDTLKSLGVKSKKGRKQINKWHLPFKRCLYIFLLAIFSLFNNRQPHLFAICEPF